MKLLLTFVLVLVNTSDLEESLEETLTGAPSMGPPTSLQRRLASRTINKFRIPRVLAY